MRIAVISDIHGNADALAQALAEAASIGVQKLLVLGDIVGYYYEPDRVLSQLTAWDSVHIRGNHEVMLAGIIDGTADATAIYKKYGSGHRTAQKVLSNDQIESLITAPDQLAFKIDGLRILLCHGAPWNNDEYLYPDTAAKVLDQCATMPVDFIFVGHSHYPFVYASDGPLLVNVGSVGQSRSRGGVASWCMLDTISRTVQLKSTPYDITPLLQAVSKTDPQNNYLSEILKRKPF